MSIAAPQLGGFGALGSGGFGSNFGGFGGSNDGFGAGLGDGIGAGIGDGIGAGIGDGIEGIGEGIGGGLGAGFGAGFGTGSNTGLGTTFGSTIRSNPRIGLGASSVSSQSINFGGGANSGFGGLSDIPSFGKFIFSNLNFHWILFMTIVIFFISNRIPIYFRNIFIFISPRKICK